MTVLGLHRMAKLVAGGSAPRVKLVSPEDVTRRLAGSASRQYLTARGITPRRYEHVAEGFNVGGNFLKANEAVARVRVLRPEDVERIDYINRQIGDLERERRDFQVTAWNHAKPITLDELRSLAGKTIDPQGRIVTSD